MGFDRRAFLSASASLAAALHVRGARAAGSLRVGFWDHWVPNANDILIKLCNEWAAREKVDLKIDFITSQGNKLLLTIASEAQAKSGHDVLAFPQWYAAGQAHNLEPVDDLMGPLLAAHGAVVPVVEYLGKQGGHWIAVPATAGSQMKGPCARIDLFRKHAGLDLTKMYPASGVPDKGLADKWTWDTLLMAAEKLYKAGVPIGIGMGPTSDSVDSVGAIFAAHGALLVDAKGAITVDSDATRVALEYCRRLAQFLPPDVFAWDDAANNKWLLSGKGSFIMNPPSSWAVAKRDNPSLAAQLWTFPAPRGPKGRYQPGLPFFWGIWKFSRNKSAARSLLLHLSQRSSIEQMVHVSGGYDVPAYAGLRDFRIYKEAGPPVGTLANYVPRDDQIVSIAGAPAPAQIATQMYSQGLLTKMVARCVLNKEPMDRVIAWTASELEGYGRA